MTPQNPGCAREGCGHRRDQHHDEHGCEAWANVPEGMATTQTCPCPAFIDPAPAPHGVKLEPERGEEEKRIVNAAATALRVWITVAEDQERSRPDPYNEAPEVIGESLAALHALTDHFGLPRHEHPFDHPPPPSTGERGEPRCPTCGGTNEEPKLVSSVGNPDDGSLIGASLCASPFHDRNWRSDEEAQVLIDAIGDLSPEVEPQEQEERWTIWACLRCGARWDVPDPPDAGFGCRADGLTSPPHEIERVEVVPASALAKAKAALAQAREDSEQWRESLESCSFAWRDKANAAEQALTEVKDHARLEKRLRQEAQTREKELVDELIRVQCLADDVKATAADSHRLYMQASERERGLREALERVIEAGQELKLIGLPMAGSEGRLFRRHQSADALLPERDVQAIDDAVAAIELARSALQASSPSPADE